MPDDDAMKELECTKCGCDIDYCSFCDAEACAVACCYGCIVEALE